MNEITLPTLEQIQNTQKVIAPFVHKTPVWPWNSPTAKSVVGDGGEVLLKLEFLQVTGSFKARGAVSVMQSLSAAQLAKGVVAVSAGNHAIAVGYAAAELGTTAKVVMPVTANRARVDACLQYGAETVFAADVHEAFLMLDAIAKNEGRSIIHPFEGPLTTLGTATLGAEFLEQAGSLDAIIVPIGGGGLASGIAVAASLIAPSCRVYGVEPVGADSMSRSFKSGRPEAIEKVSTIADSLGAPRALPYSFGVCHKLLTEIVLVSDPQLKEAMNVIFKELKFALEPAGAAAVAGMLGPLREKLKGQRVGVIMCGSNIDGDTFCRLLR